MQHLTEENIAMCAEALDNGTYEQLPITIREHLSQCDQCAEEVLVVADISNELVDFNLKEIKPYRDKKQRIIAWSVSVAAAIAFILLIIEVGPFNNNDNQDQYLSQNHEVSEAKKDSDKPEKQTNTEENKENEGEHSQTSSENPDREKYPTASLPPADTPPRDAALPPVAEKAADTLKFLAHMEPDENLENLVKRFEGTLRTNNDVSVKSPLTIRANETTITIEWTNPNKNRLIIEVFDNTGNRILETETNEEEYTLRNLTEGLYYWKLISSDFDLLFCGRIIIE